MATSGENYWPPTGRTSWPLTSTPRPGHELGIRTLHRSVEFRCTRHPGITEQHLSKISHFVDFGQTPPPETDEVMQQYDVRCARPHQVRAHGPPDRTPNPDAAGHLEIRRSCTRSSHPSLRRASRRRFVRFGYGGTLAGNLAPTGSSTDTRVRVMPDPNQARHPSRARHRSSHGGAFIPCRSPSLELFTQRPGPGTYCSTDLR